MRYKIRHRARCEWMKGDTVGNDSLEKSPVRAATLSALTHPSGAMASHNPTRISQLPPRIESCHVHLNETPESGFYDDQLVNSLSAYLPSPPRTVLRTRR